MIYLLINTFLDISDIFNKVFFNKKEDKISSKGGVNHDFVIVVSSVFRIHARTKCCLQRNDIIRFAGAAL